MLRRFYSLSIYQIMHYSAMRSRQKKTKQNYDAYCPSGRTCLFNVKVDDLRRQLVSIIVFVSDRPELLSREKVITCGGLGHNEVHYCTAVRLESVGESAAY